MRLSDFHYARLLAPAVLACFARGEAARAPCERAKTLRIRHTPSGCMDCFCGRTFFALYNAKSDNARLIEKGESYDISTSRSIDPVW
jgi:hypothetical protein